MVCFRHDTFRHSYSTLLIANGENVKVVQELMLRQQQIHAGDLLAGANRA